MAATSPEATVAHRNLPAQPTPFIGRKQQVDAVCALVRREDVRLVTLTGPGGTGKTRLAVEVLAQIAGDFADDAFFVPLAAINDPALVISCIAQPLGLMDTGDKDHPVSQTLKGFLRDKRCLLLLDNFEQVLAAAQSIADLIAGTRNLKVIVTSRERLHLRGEHEFPVPPFKLPATQPLPPIEGLMEYEAVRLFIERAAALRPDFKLADNNALYIAEICNRLDGLPLAIELAAARIKILPPEAILTRLDRRLKLLTGGESDLPARHQTLRNAIAWSYDLLDDAEKIVFTRLAVFSGGGNLDSIESICNPPLADQQPAPDFDVLDAVASLVDKNLLRQAASTAGEPRFVMLETIGEFAREKLVESGDAAEMQSRHASFFRTLAEQAEAELTGPQQLYWLQQLELEHDNMRAAIKWALDSGDGDTALRLCSALHQFWKMRGHMSEGYSWLEDTLARSVKTPSPSRAKALMAAGTLASAQGDFARARSALEESLNIFKELGDRESMISTLRNLGNELRVRGDLEGSWAAMQEALEIARDLGKEWEISSLLGDMGIVAQTLGNTETARAMYLESLSLRRQLRDTRGIAMMLVNLGEIARADGEYDTANELYTEGLALARELGDKWGVGMVLHNMGHVAYHRRDYIHAWNLFTQSLSIFHELRNKRDIAYCLAALAGLYGARRHPSTAAVLFSAAQAITNTISSHLDPADLIEYERNLATTQSQMSQTEWERAWVKGQSLTLDEAVAYALQGPPVLDQTGPLRPATRGTGPLGFPTVPLGDAPGILTDREVDVLRLVAAGLPDTVVGDTLGISPRTVQRHLSSIYSKLGVTSRTGATRAAMEQELF